MAAGIFSKLKKLVQVVGKGVSWMNVKIVKSIIPISNALFQSLGPAGSVIANGMSAGSSEILRYSDRMIVVNEKGPCPKHCLNPIRL
ncbi:MAG: hypothetical protein EZS28_054159 [Streblomastix strix]|uniref:Uncharacterized protein n=1 Tax=Streblomastix strix TaxID=222440 RepID=A0A5J4QTJ3_9EUKA|nr:MAG: hypothetical protein EZS28_054159 [Streblomastix strix]